MLSPRIPGLLLGSCVCARIAKLLRTHLLACIRLLIIWYIELRAHTFLIMRTVYTPLKNAVNASWDCRETEMSQARRSGMMVADLDPFQLIQDKLGAPLCICVGSLQGPNGEMGGSCTTTEYCKESRCSISSSALESIRVCLPFRASGLASTW